MRTFFLILSCWLAGSTFCQSLTDKYLHYRTDYYWDTALYKSEQKFYYENNNGRITQKDYPVLEYFFTQIITDSPLVTRDSFTRRNFSYDPYKYIRKGHSIYLQYFDLRKKKFRLNREYTLTIGETVKWLLNKNSLGSSMGPDAGGSSIYLGEEKVEINGKSFTTFKFKEDHDEHSWEQSTVIFLDQATLIPVKILTGSYYSTTREKPLYNSVTLLVSTSDSLQDYTNTKSGDMVLYENKNTTWTEKQKQEFMKSFSPDMKQYGECLLKKLDGRISFFLFQGNSYFRRLISNEKCE